MGIKFKCLNKIIMLLILGFSTTIMSSCDNSKKATPTECFEFTKVKLDNKKGYSIRLKEKPKNISEIIIPKKYKSLPVIGIDTDAFFDCGYITSIEIPNSVILIGGNAFAKCGLLTSIIIPNSVTRIFPGAFNHCSSLTIYCETSNQPMGWEYGWNDSKRPVYWGVTAEDIYTQDDIQYIIQNGEATITGHTLDLPTNVIIPNIITIDGKEYSVTSIGSYAFTFTYHWAPISIVIPSNVINIEMFAFYDTMPPYLTIYCEVDSQPSGWYMWHSSGEVYWAGEWSYVDGVPTPNK